MKKVILLFILVLVLLGSCVSGPQAQKRRDFYSENGRLIHRGQEIFVSGINLAWVNFGNDMANLDAKKFTQALDDVANAGGNTLRWWMYVNCTGSPTFKNKKVVSLGENDIKNLKIALDLAWDRGVLLVLCLFSFDMYQPQVGARLEANRLMIENAEYTRALIDNALTPLVKSVKDHPALLAWEIMNEPEGLAESFGWTPKRSKMEDVQRFVNLVTGGIHRADPKALVTNGTWSFQVLTDIKGLTNYYRDDRLVKAGGDPLGTLDFYQVHYYPSGYDEMLSPFHNPASYWKLDKPILVGEFPAKGIVPITGMGFLPKIRLTSEEAYNYLFMNGYAGGLSWTWTNHDGFGGIKDAEPGLQSLKKSLPELVVIDQGPDFNKAPEVVGQVKNLKASMNDKPMTGYADLSAVFSDREDKTNLTYTIAANSNPGAVAPSVDASGKLAFDFVKDGSGIAKITVRATDSKGRFADTSFYVYVVDPDRGNLALGRPTESLADEGPDIPPSKAVDGDPKSRWSSAWVNDQWMIVDLESQVRISKVVLNWEVAYGKSYTIDVSTDKVKWTTVFTENASDGEIDEITFPPVTARYVRMNGITRATQWGFSLWEFEVYPAPK